MCGFSKISKIKLNFHIYAKQKSIHVEIHHQVDMLINTQKSARKNSFGTAIVHTVR